MIDAAVAESLAGIDDVPPRFKLVLVTFYLEHSTGFFGIDGFQFLQDVVRHLGTTIREPVAFPLPRQLNALFLRKHPNLSEGFGENARHENGEYQNG